MSELRHGSVKDSHVDYNLRRDVIWADRYAIASATYPAGQAASAQFLGAAFSVGSRPFVAMSQSGMGAIYFNALNNGATIPWMAYDIDNRQNVYIRHLWTTPNRNVTDIVRFTTTYHSITTSSSIRTPTSVLNVTIQSATKGAAVEFAPTWSTWGVIGKLATGALANQVFSEDTYGLLLDTTLASTNVEVGKTNGGVFLIATEIAYTPRETFGDGSRREARYLESPLSFKEAGPSQDLP